MQEQAMAQQAQMMQEQMAQAQQMEAQKSQKFDPEAAQMQTQLDVQKSQAQIEAKMMADIEKMRERSRLTQENDAAKSIVEISKENLRNQIMQNQSPTIGNE
jgi:hypothetical protein